MPDVLAPVRPSPPANEAVIGPTGDRHSQAWTQYHKSVSDWISTQGIGTTDGSEAAVGAVGEFMDSIVAVGGAVSLSNLAAADVTYIELTAGDWDVWGSVVFVGSGAYTIIAGWLSPASATSPGDLSDGGYSSLHVNFTAGSTNALPVGRIRALMTTTGPIYLSALAGFSGSMSVYGRLSARRMR